MEKLDTPRASRSATDSSRRVPMRTGRGHDEDTSFVADYSARPPSRPRRRRAAQLSTVGPAAGRYSMYERSVKRDRRMA